jgi:hypothetical protein
MENEKDIQYSKEKLDNIENIVFTSHKGIKVMYSLLVEYRGFLNDLKSHNEKQDKQIASCEEKLNKLLELITNEISGDTPSSKRCQYSDKQIYNMHYGLGYKKKYSLNELVSLTGMSRSFIQQHISKYKNKVNKEV